MPIMNKRSLEANVDTSQVSVMKKAGWKMGNIPEKKVKSVKQKNSPPVPGDSEGAAPKTGNTPSGKKDLGNKAA